MGVLGLWQLLSPVGQPVTLESLENKIFAVDISIWLNQALKGYRDSQGGSVPNAHLLSLFSRLCKLLFYKIRPIIVFDGGFPELKKQTIINRQERRAAVKRSSRDVGLKILTNYLASQQLTQNINTGNCSKNVFKTKEKPRDEIFKLPPMPESPQNNLCDSSENEEDYERKFTDFSREDIKYLNKIDIESEDFDALPPDVKQEILSTLKESRKYRSWDQYEELPKESNEFSSYQMQCLLKRRKIQNKLEQVQKDIRQINSSAYVSQYTNDHVIGETNKIMSDDISYYVLLKKIIDSKKTDNKLSDMPGSSVMTDTKNAFLRDVENIDVDFSNDSSYINNSKNRHLCNEIKAEKDSLSLSDEEYEVDNPPEKINKTFLSADNSFNQEIKTCLDNSLGEFPCSSVNNVLHASSQNEKCTTSNDSPKSIFNAKKSSPDSLLLSTEDKKVPRNDDNTDVSLSLIGTDLKKKSNAYEKNVNSKDVLKKNYEPKSLINSKLEMIGNTSVKSTVNITFIDKNSKEEFITEEFHMSNNTLQNNRDQSKNAISAELGENVYQHLENELVVTSSKIGDAKLMDTEENKTKNITEENLELHKNVYEHSENDLVVTSKIQNGELIVNEKNKVKNITEENLELQKNLSEAAAILEAKQAKQDRQSSTVQDHMIEDCKELLKLFGIPFIVSPLEAEAQCAFYDKADLTHGTITDDSDVWLFGGRKVYKNFFTQQKFVECYKDKEIFTHFGLSRNKLINFALLTGSDYTEGIEGVGPVTAMEIISEFPGDDINSLKKFKEWWEESNKHARPPENKVRAKLLKLVLPKNFPDSKVFDAYLNPEVDESTEKFTWGRPDLDALREYTREKFGWNQKKVDDALLPVLKKLNERNSQTHLDSFFTVTLKKETNLFPSKRIMSALKKITSPRKQETETSPKCKTFKRKLPSTSSKKKIKKTVKKASNNKNVKIQNQGPNLSEESSSD